MQADMGEAPATRRVESVMVFSLVDVAVGRQGLQRASATPPRLYRPQHTMTAVTHFEACTASELISFRGNSAAGRNRINRAGNSVRDASALPNMAKLTNTPSQRCTL